MKRDPLEQHIPKYHTLISEYLPPFLLNSPLQSQWSPRKVSVRQWPGNYIHNYATCTEGHATCVSACMNECNLNLTCFWREITEMATGLETFNFGCITCITHVWGFKKCKMMNAFSIIFHCSPCPLLPPQRYSCSQNNKRHLLTKLAIFSCIFLYFWTNIVFFG